MISATTDIPSDTHGKPLTRNPHLIRWVAGHGAAHQAGPDRVGRRLGGGEEPASPSVALKEEVLLPLNQEKLPGCYLHRSNPNDVARVEQLTFICTPTKEQAGPTNNWMAPGEAYAKLGKLFDGSMKGRTMYVVPYVMGPVGSPMSKIGIELTDSVYVVLNMRIMTRMGKPALDMLGDSNDFNRGLHCTLDCNPERRYICHFPQDNTILSVGQRLRRQRAARQEVPRAAHRQLPRARPRAGSPSTCSSSASRAPTGR